jgi:drug/metabolite transporter (DMT)-like permease
LGANSLCGSNWHCSSISFYIKWFTQSFRINYQRFRNARTYFAGAVAWFWFSESWTAIQLLGGVIVIAGIYMADRARSAAK